MIRSAIVAVLFCCFASVAAGQECKGDACKVGERVKQKSVCMSAKRIRSCGERGFQFTFKRSIKRARFFCRKCF